MGGSVWSPNQTLGRELHEPFQGQDEMMAKKYKLALTKIWFNQLLLSLPKPHITKTIELAEGSGYYNNTENDTPEQEAITDADVSILVRLVDKHKVDVGGKACCEPLTGVKQVLEFLFLELHFFVH